jgi:filamentous hemagglutinin
VKQVASGAGLRGIGSPRAKHRKPAGHQLYDSKQTSSSLGVSLCIPPYWYGMSSGGSVSVGKTNMDSTCQSVTEQGGIRVEEGGIYAAVRYDRSHCTR